MTDPATPAALDADVLDRMRRQHRRIEDLFESYALRSLSPSFGMAESARRVAQACVLLRLQARFEAQVLQRALISSPSQPSHVPPNVPALVRCARQRGAVLAAAQHAEQAQAAAEVGHAMARLALQARIWFELRERELLPVLHHAALDPGVLEPHVDHIEQALMRPDEHGPADLRSSLTAPADVGDRPGRS